MLVHTARTHRTRNAIQRSIMRWEQFEQSPLSIQIFHPDDRNKDLDDARDVLAVQGPETLESLHILQPA